MICTNNKAKKKGAQNEYLNYHSLSFVIIDYHDLFSDAERLLSHAEMLKDISEHFVGLYFAAGYFAEMEETAAQVFTDEI